ncbi:type I-F CRISPR-associated protein Csy2 [Salinicola acroporae]|uniref:Type I-F CRISPR-associated protein Csy2 n=1 Tax=Salinicola acroporae TaxID=1541440 RepID=A0ABT6I3Y9_9GAMM|nr:type I-F CRISPR-associated protein Csy2 [Salinicola acroporae]MDH4571935.1 type I-F CRISPR-associated protein Csy2 [Salinicola acroporae]
MIDSISHLLVLPHLRIQNANAISSSMTWGFPAMSAFMGAVQALERSLPDDIQIVFDGVGVVCHHIEPQVTEGGFTRAFHLTRNPVDKSGATAAIVEEGRAHLDVTLLIGIESDGDDLSNAERRRAIARQLFDQVQSMRIAGGSVMPSLNESRRQRPELITFDDNEEERSKQWRRLKRRLLPGFALVLRDDYLTEHTKTLEAEDDNATALDAWLDLCRLNHECRIETHQDKDGQTKEVAKWEIRRPYPGWLVPIPVGYGAISELFDPGEVANARDSRVPFQFVESLYSIGEWVSPHRLRTPDALLWFVDNDLERGVYRLTNDYSLTHSNAD